MRYEKDQLPVWQNELVEDIVSALHAYYCLYDDATLKSIEQLAKDLVNALQRLNKELEQKSLRPPMSEYEYHPFLKVINTILEHFDSHCHIQYARHFIAERNGNEIVKNIQAARFELGGPPLDVLEQMNSFRGRPDQNYGFSNVPPLQINLPTDVGYLKMNYSLDPRLGEEQKDDKYRVGPHAIEAATRALAKLQGKKRIIIDLRVAWLSEDKTNTIIDYS